MKLVTRHRRKLLVLAGLALPSCATIIGVENTSFAPGGDAGAGEGSVADAASDGSPTDGGVGDAIPLGDGSTCTGTAGPSMIRVGNFCIDTTEVTVKSYQDFFEANVDAAAQPKECLFNKDFTPQWFPWPPNSGDFELPITGVDWCDAYAYCAWAGKRLCGFVKPAMTTPEWLVACRGDAGNKYPYGNAYEAGACDDSLYDGGGPNGDLVPVGSLPGCQGGYPGLFDMSGNASEWIDYCVRDNTDPDAAGDDCASRGGDYWSLPDQVTCDTEDMHPRGGSNGLYVGIRCCTD